MKKEKKYQVQWRQKDNKGWYDTFIYANSREGADTYAQTAKLNGCVRIQIIDLTPISR